MNRTRIHHHVKRLAPHAEHVGFVAYAACESLKFHIALAFISIYLTVTGLIVMIVGAGEVIVVDDLHRREEAEESDNA